MLFKKFDYSLEALATLFDYSEEELYDFTLSNQIEFHVNKSGLKSYDIHDFITVFTRKKITDFVFARKIDSQDIYFALSKEKEYEISLENIIYLLNKNHE